MKRQSSIKIVLMLLALAVTSLTLAQKSSLVRIHENVRVTLTRKKNMHFT